MDSYVPTTEEIELRRRLKAALKEAVEISPKLLAIEKRRGRFGKVNLPGYYGYQGGQTEE